MECFIGYMRGVVIIYSFRFINLIFLSPFQKNKYSTLQCLLLGNFYISFYYVLCNRKYFRVQHEQLIKPLQLMQIRNN